MTASDPMQCSIGGSTPTESNDAIADELERILVLGSTPEGASVAIASAFDANLTFDYISTRPALAKLYDRARVSQWNAQTDLDWSIDVDRDRVARDLGSADGRIARLREHAAGPLRTWSETDWERLEYETLLWRISQFLHGEQGAMLCAARIVETVPWIDAKNFAATQVLDEARHSEVFARYLDEKLEGIYPANAHLLALLQSIIGDARWDVTYLGMQIILEGLALTAFGFMLHMTNEPLLRKALRYVLTDEARHVAFGVLSLEEVYKEMDASEIRERQEFALEAAMLMRDRLLQQEVWERLGLDVRTMLEQLITLRRERDGFEAMLFSKIVPNCRRIGLLDAGDGWLRAKFGELGVLRFEDQDDANLEYANRTHGTSNDLVLTKDR